MDSCGNLKHWRYCTTELKTCYQKNMFRGMCFVYGPLVLLTAIIVVWSSVVDRDTITISFGTSETQDSFESLPGGTNGGGNSQYRVTNSTKAHLSASYHGFSSRLPDVLGSNTHNYRIVRDIHQMAVRTSDFANVSIPGHCEEPIFSDGILEVKPGEKYAVHGDGYDGNDLYGIGNNTFGLPNGIYWTPPPRLPGDRGGSGGLIQPLFLGLADPGFPAEAKKSTVGKVVFDITVHEDGLITYRIKSVTPSCEGFHRATEYAIFNGIYSPLMVNGVPVRQTVEVTLIYVYTGPRSSTLTTEFTKVPGSVRAQWIH